MDKYIYIHSGSWKTGTCSLQYFLRDYHEDLFKKFNLYIPNSILKFDSTKNWHAKVTSFLVKGELMPIILSEMEKYKDSSFLFSDEDLSKNIVDKNLFYKFKSAFPQHKIKVIQYIRKMDRFLQSVYNQLLKHGGLEAAQNYGEFLLAMDKQEASHIHQAAGLEQWQQLIGKENVVVKIYDRNLLKNGNIIDDIFNIIGISVDSEFSTNKESNKSLDDRIAPFMSKYIRPTKMASSYHKIFRKLAQNVTASNNTLKNISQIEESIKQEIERLDKLCPGYAAIHTTFNLDNTEFNTDPAQLYLAGLMYETLDELSRLRQHVNEVQGEFAKISLMLTTKENESIFNEFSRFKKWIFSIFK